MYSDFGFFFIFPSVEHLECIITQAQGLPACWIQPTLKYLKLSIKQKRISHLVTAEIVALSSAPQTWYKGHEIYSAMHQRPTWQHQQTTMKKVEMFPDNIQPSFCILSPPIRLLHQKPSSWHAFSKLTAATCFCKSSSSWLLPLGCLSLWHAFISAPMCTRVAALQKESFSPKSSIWKLEVLWSSYTSFTGDKQSMDLLEHDLCSISGNGSFPHKLAFSLLLRERKRLQASPSWWLAAPTQSIGCKSMNEGPGLKWLAMAATTQLAASRKSAPCLDVVEWLLWVLLRWSKNTPTGCPHPPQAAHEL